jgi:hypothetical protein
MKHNCPKCGAEYELGLSTLPECSECIRMRMIHPDGVSTKHTPGTAPAKASYIADGVDAKAVFDYMSGGSHSQPSGCVIYYAPKYNSFNAVSYKPLHDIPGSGNFTGTPMAHQFAVLQDIQGKSSQGPHWTFEEETHLQRRVETSEWVPAPKCSKCGNTCVYNRGDLCLNCLLSGGGSGA